MSIGDAGLCQCRLPLAEMPSVDAHGTHVAATCLRGLAGHRQCAGRRRRCVNGDARQAGERTRPVCDEPSDAVGSAQHDRALSLRLGAAAAAVTQLDGKELRRGATLRVRVPAHAASGGGLSEQWPAGICIKSTSHHDVRMHDDDARTHGSIKRFSKHLHAQREWRRTLAV